MDADAAGNLRYQSWDEIWYSEAAEKVREAVRNCPKQCWMMGSVGQEIKKHPGRCAGIWNISGWTAD